jgi:hypothetical protein
MHTKLYAADHPFFNRWVGGAILALCVTTLAAVGTLISLNRFTLPAVDEDGGHE